MFASAESVVQQPVPRGPFLESNVCQVDLFAPYLVVQR